jgi:hypothetical protein
MTEPLTPKPILPLLQRADAAKPVIVADCTSSGC